MATKKTVKKVKEVKKEEVQDVSNHDTPKVAPLTQEFGNGDLNVLKDKINEIIANS